MNGIARVAVSIVLLALAVFPVFWVADASTLSAATSEYILPSIVPVTLLLLGGVFLSSLRLKLITADFGHQLTFRDAAMTLSVGQIAGNAFFQLAGQLIGRSAVMSRKGISPAATVVISGYERVIALSVSLLLAAAGALYLFGTLGLNLEQGGVSLVKLTMGVAAVLAGGAIFVWGPKVRDFARNATPELLLRLLRSFLMSLAIQGTTLAAYVALEKALAPHIGIASLAAASCIVMLAASLPISLGGWGLRELSAVVALQAVGLSSASALLTALLIGFLSLLVVAGTAAFFMVGWRPDAGPRATVTKDAAPDYAAALDWVLAPVAATAVFFQIYVPVSGGQISVNLADPVVIIGASLFVLHHIGKCWPSWTIPHAGAWVAATTAVIFLSIAHGWISFGWTDWAFVNKGLGWLMLLCYGATGALLVRRAQERGLDILLKTFAASGAAIVLIEIGIVLSVQLGMDLGHRLYEARAAGLSQNPNAFAFLLVLVLAAAIVLHERAAVRTGLIALALIGIWLSGSRAGFLAVPVVMGVAWAMGVALRPLVMAVLAAVAGVVFIAALPYAIYAMQLTAGIQSGESILTRLVRSGVSNGQHLQTVYDGLAMFMAHPLFGAGIGAYLHGQVGAPHLPMVIHSSPVWLLAETGIVGSVVFMAAAWRLFADALRRRGSAAGLMLLLVLCTLVVMSLAHEMLYQRAFWLLLGALLALTATATTGQGRPSAPLTWNRAGSF